MPKLIASPISPFKTSAYSSRASWQPVKGNSGGNAAIKNSLPSSARWLKAMVRANPKSSVVVIGEAPIADWNNALTLSTGGYLFCGAIASNGLL